MNYLRLNFTIFTILLAATLKQIQLFRQRALFSYSIMLFKIIKLILLSLFIVLAVALLFLIPQHLIANIHIEDR